MNSKKINLLLFGILILLLIFTYFFEEKSQSQKREQERLETEIFSFSKFGEIEKLTLGQQEIILVQGKYYLSKGDLKRPLDEAMMSHIFDSLSQIRTRRILTEDETKNLAYSTYQAQEGFSFSFKFTKEKDVFVFTLGEKLSFSKDFYMSLFHKGKRKVMLAYNDIPLSNVHTHEDATLSSEPYQKIKTLLYLDPTMLIDKSLFLKSSDWLSCEEIELKRKGQRPFVVRPNVGVTHPPIHSSLNYNVELMKEWRKVVSSLRANEIKEEYPIKEEAQAELTCDGKLKLKIFRQENKFLAVHSLGKEVFFLSENVRELFFINEQIFWQLSPIIDWSEALFSTQKPQALPLFVKDFVSKGADFVHKPDKFDQRDDKILATLKSKDMTLHFTSRGSDIIMKDEKNQIWFFYLQKLEEWKKHLP
jgi:hypothetical protein